MEGAATNQWMANNKQTKNKMLSNRRKTEMASSQLPAASSPCAHVIPEQKVVQVVESSSDEDDADTLGVKYHVIEGATARGSDQLVDTDGFSYVKDCKSYKSGRQRWRCSVRNRNLCCNAAVFQTGDIFKPGSKPHICQPNECALSAARIKAQLKREGLIRPFTSAATLVTEALRDNNLEPGAVASPKLSVSALVRSTNYKRRFLRPQKKTALEFEVVDDQLDDPNSAALGADLSGNAVLLQIVPARQGSSGLMEDKPFMTSWTEEGIQFFLEIVRDHADMLTSSATDMEFWNNIACELNGKGYRYTHDTCIKKWRQLRFRYQQILCSNKGSTIGQKWPYFDLMDDILAGDAFVAEGDADTSATAWPSRLSAADGSVSAPTCSGAAAGSTARPPTRSRAAAPASPTSQTKMLRLTPPPTWFLPFVEEQRRHHEELRDLQREAIDVGRERNNIMKALAEALLKQSK